jgi:hypothetical protein
MPVEIYLVILMFSITLAALISAINARGTAKIVLSYIFASLVLLASVYVLLTFMTDKELAAKEAEKLKYEEQLKLAEEEARLANEQNASVEGEKKYKADLMSIVNSGSDIARAVLSVNVEDEDVDFDVLVGRSASLKGQAYRLKKDFEDTKAPKDVKGFDDARRDIEKAIKNLTVAGNYFNLYFKAEDEEEEDERYDIYRANANAARSNFSRASNKLED